MKEFDPKDTLVEFGSAIKSTNDKGGIGGHLVLFGDPKSKDLYGDFFTGETDFDLHDGQKSAVYYQHGFDFHFKSNVLSRATLGADDVGIWIEAQLDIHDEYMEALSDLISEGLMGWSSGTAGHLVEAERRGKAYWIKRWPLGLDASITPNPADPRQVDTLRFLQEQWEKQYGSVGEEGRRFILSLKHLMDPSPRQEVPQETVPAQDVSARTSGDEAGSDTQSTLASIEVRTMSDTQEQTPDPRDAQIAELKAANAKFSADMQDVMEYINSQRKLRGAGYVTDDGGSADAQVKSFGDFCLAVMRQDTKRLKTIYKSHPASALKSDMVEDSGELGGWAIPEDFSAQLLTARQAMPSFINLVSRIPVGMPAGRWPRLDIFTAPSAGVGDVAEAAGATAEVRAEGGAYTETNPLLEQIEYRVNDAISGYMQVSRELRQDVSALEGLLMQLISITDLAKQEYFVLRGNGVGQPLGVMNSAAMIAVTTATNSIFAWADVLNMAARLYAVDGSRVAWVHHPGIIPDLGVLEVGTGGAVWIANMPGGAPANLYGYPTYKSQHSPQDDNSGDVILADWSQYQIWDRGGAYVDFSEHVGFLNGLDTWRFGRRMDGKPLWLSTSTLADPTGSYTVSPFVKHDD